MNVILQTLLGQSSPFQGMYGFGTCFNHRRGLTGIFSNWNCCLQIVPILITPQDSSDESYLLSRVDTTHHNSTTVNDEDPTNPFSRAPVSQNRALVAQNTSLLHGFEIKGLTFRELDLPSPSSACIIIHVFTIEKDSMNCTSFKRTYTLYQIYNKSQYFF